MKELLESLHTIPLNEVNKGVFIDTCFLLDELNHHRAAELDNLQLLSFNAEELVHVAQHIPHLKKGVRNFLKKHTVTLVTVPVHPGEREKEKSFVNHIHTDILKIIADPSDAVLLAAALQTRSTVLTKDKHHLFTTNLENFLEEYHIKVFKEMKDYLDWKEALDTYP